MKHLLLLASIGLFLNGCMGQKMSNDPTISLESAVQCDNQTGQVCIPNCTNMQDGRYCLISLSFNKGDHDFPPLDANPDPYLVPIEMGKVLNPKDRWDVSLYEQTIYQCSDTIAKSGRNTTNSCVVKFQYFASDKPFTQNIQFSISGIQAQLITVTGVHKN